MSALGSMLLSEAAVEEVVQILNEEDFYRPAHRTLFESMRRLANRKEAIDFLTLKDDLVSHGKLADVGGSDYILQLAEYVPSPANASYYAGIVRDKSTLRKLEDAGRQILGVVRDVDGGSAKDRVDKAEQLVFEVGKTGIGRYFQPVRHLAKKFFEEVDDIIETGKPLTGLKVDFYDLDRITTGFYPGDFVIIGARPAMGKTSLVLDMALNVAKQTVREEKKASVAVFSLEMSSEQLVRRMASMLSGVSTGVLKRENALTPHYYQKLADACDLLEKLPIFIDDSSGVTPLEMRGSA